MKRESINFDDSQENPSPEELRPEDISKAIGSPEDVRGRIGEELAPIEAKNRGTTESAKEQRTERFERNVQALKGLTDQTEAQATKKGYNGPLSRLAEMGRRYIGVALLSMVAAGCGTSTKSEYSSKDRPAEIAAGHQDSTVAGKRERNRERIRQRTEEWRQREAAEIEEERKKAEQKVLEEEREEEEREEMARLLSGFLNIPVSEHLDDGSVSLKMNVINKEGKTIKKEYKINPENFDRAKKFIELAKEEETEKAFMSQTGMQKKAIEKAFAEMIIQIGLEEERKEAGLEEVPQNKGVRLEPSPATEEEREEAYYNEKYREYKRYLDERMREAKRPAEVRAVYGLTELIENQLARCKGYEEAGKKMLSDEPNESPVGRAMPDDFEIFENAVKAEIKKIFDISNSLTDIKNRLEKGELSAKDAREQLNELDKIGLIKNSVIIREMEKQRASQKEREKIEKQSEIDHSKMARLLSGFLNIPVSEHLDDGSVSLKMNVINKEGKTIKKEYKINPENFSRVKKLIEIAKQENPDLDEKQKQQQRDTTQKTLANTIIQIGKEIKE